VIEDDYANEMDEHHPGDPRGQRHRCPGKRQRQPSAERGTRNCCIAADPMISAAAMGCVPSGVTTGAYPRRGTGR
jgi:hypothetical protein